MLALCVCVSEIDCDELPDKEALAEPLAEPDWDNVFVTEPVCVVDDVPDSVSIADAV